MMDVTEMSTSLLGNEYICTCQRTFATYRGLNQHLRFCLMKLSDTTDIIQSSQPLPSELSVETFNSENICDTVENEFINQVSEAYDAIVYWKNNFFELPKCSFGKDFIHEMTILINTWNSGGPGHNICIKALMIMPALLLQRSSKKAKTADNKRHLQRRLQLWKDKKISELLSEGKTIQSRIKLSTPTVNNEETLSKKFAQLMMQGKVNPAIRLLEKGSKSGILPLSENTMECLLEKHPEASPRFEQMLLQGPTNKINDIIYDDINAELIKKCSIKTKGASGPSGLDADYWRKLIGSRTYGNVSDDLSHAIALMTRKLCINRIEDPESISALTSCRLIPLDKNPGLRPIGIGEVLRRIMGKAVMIVLKPDVLEATGYEQLCAGIEAGCEAGVHTVKDLFDLEDTHGFIQVDASNAFNTINRSVLLRNVEIICPEVSLYMSNLYALRARLFITGGEEIRSNEGTTQGDPTAMSMYALAIMPLLETIVHDLDATDLKQVAFADDLTGVGNLKSLKVWWDAILKYGPYIGYTVNQRKS